MLAVVAACALIVAMHPHSETAKLTQTFVRIEHKPIYRQSTWGYDVLNQRTGQVLASQNDEQMFDPGSTMKL